MAQTLGEIGSVTVMQFASGPIWFDVMLNGKHHKGFANLGDAFAEMLNLANNQSNADIE